MYDVVKSGVPSPTYPLRDNPMRREGGQGPGVFKLLPFSLHDVSNLATLCMCAKPKEALEQNLT